QADVSFGLELFFVFSSRRRHTRSKRDWSSDVCSSDLDEEQISIVEEYAKANGLWYSPEDPEPEYTQVIEVNLDDIVPNLAGPKRPHDRVPLSDMKTEFRKAITAPEGNHGFGLDA